MEVVRTGCPSGFLLFSDAGHHLSCTLLIPLLGLGEASSHGTGWDFLINPMKDED